MNDNPTPGHNVAPDGKPWPSQLAHLVTSTVGHATPPTPAGADSPELAAAREILNNPAPSFKPTEIIAYRAATIARHFQPLREELARVKAREKDLLLETYRMATAPAIDDPELGIVAPKSDLAALRTENAVLREEVEKLKADVSREVTLCDQMTMQRVPIDDDEVNEFVKMTLSRHTLLNSDERQDCADQILTAFAPTWEKLTAAEARCTALEEMAAEQVTAMLNKIKVCDQLMLALTDLKKQLDAARQHKD